MHPAVALMNLMLFLLLLQTWSLFFLTDCSASALVDLPEKITRHQHLSH